MELEQPATFIPSRSSLPTMSGGIGLKRANPIKTQERQWKEKTSIHHKHT